MKQRLPTLVALLPDSAPEGLGSSARDGIVRGDAVGVQRHAGAQFQHGKVLEGETDRAGSAEVGENLSLGMEVAGASELAKLRSQQFLELGPGLAGFGVEQSLLELTEEIRGGHGAFR